MAAYAVSKLGKIPSLLYGTAWKGEATAGLVITAVAAGFKGIDTAAQRKHYREDLVGVGIEQAEKELGISREMLWLQTKLVRLRID
jgi:diketogulonate reductase-like aldo/keto reductase